MFYFLCMCIVHRVAENKEVNQMPITNLALVLGVSLVGYPAEHHKDDTYIVTMKAKMVRVTSYTALLQCRELSIKLAWNLHK